TAATRDGAAKGALLLGIQAVVATGFGRIHRSNLVGMGVLPLQLTAGQSWEPLGLTGSELIDIVPPAVLKPRCDVAMVVTRADGSRQNVVLPLRLDTPIEVEYFHNGGLLPFVMRQLLG